MKDAAPSFPAHLLPTEDEVFKPGNGKTIMVRGERDKFLKSLVPSPYPDGITPGNMITRMQLKAREQYLAGRNTILVSSTSSGKTIAGTAPFFESGEPTVFVYPYRALLYDQGSTLIDVARKFGYDRHNFGYLMGGVNGREMADQISPQKPFLLATPDKLISLFLGGRSGVMAAAAVLSAGNFFFDEVHGYNLMMRRSLIYFLRSVRLLQERQRLDRKPVFTFASATTPDDLLHELRTNLGIRKRDIISGPSYTGDVTVEVLVPKSARKRGNHPIAEDMQARGHTSDTIVVVQNPFDAWMISTSNILQNNSLLFVGQDKQSEKERQGNLKQFTENPRGHVLVGSPAIEAGVDFAAANLYAQESTGSSTAQAVGRSGRGGRKGNVVYYGHRLFHFAATGKLKKEYSRNEWNELLRSINPERPPRAIMIGLAASPYIQFWGQEVAEEIVDPGDMVMYEEMKERCPKGHLAFRSLTPYTSYESGERISFRALFRKMLSVENKKVKGAPNANRYFFADKRATVRAHIRRATDVAVSRFEELERNGRKLTVHRLMARVDFGSFGRHWTVLEIGPTDALGEDFIPDNIHLSLEGTPIAGPGMERAVRFYD